MRRRIVLLATLAALASIVCGAPRAEALDPAKRITQYVYDAWGVREGLPVASVLAVARTPDGYLWVGTESGLLRFDGVRFTLVDRRVHPDLGADINELIVDRAGTLWIGTLHGLVRWRDGVTTRYTTAEGLVDDRIVHLAEGRDGAIWISTRGGLSRFADGRWTSYTTRDGLPHEIVQYVHQARDGSVWIATNGGLAHLVDGRVTTLTTKEGLATNVVLAVHEDQKGALWIGTFSGLHRLVDGRLTLYTTKDGLSHDLVDDFVEDAEGSLWISTYGGGLTRYREGRFDRFDKPDGLSAEFINALLLDRDGSLWVAMDHGGLGRLRDGLVTPYTTKEGLPVDAIRCVLQDSAGALWLGTHGGGLTRMQDGRITTFTTKDGLPSDLIFALAEDRQGRLWIGAYNGGLSVMEHGRFRTIANEQLPRNQFVTVIHEDRDGAIWLGTHGGGLKRLAGDTMTTFTTRDGLTSDFIKDIVEDRAGTLWIGTWRGVTRLAQGRFTSVSPTDGLPDAQVLALLADTDGSIWVAVEQGRLSRVKDGRVVPLDAAVQDIFADTIFRMIPDGHGNIWFTSNRGIHRIPRQELHDVAEGRRTSVSAVLYGIGDGMKTTECNGGTQPAGWRANDGRLWFPTQHGVVVVDPARAHAAAAPPGAIVESLIVDGRTLPASAEAPVVPPGSRQVEFHYTAPQLHAPDRVRFRYRLDGYDTDWVDAGTRRVAYYTDLPPGARRFRVATAVDAGPWSTTEGTLALRIAPRFYQTWWFAAAAIAAVAGLLWGAHYYRVNQLLAMERVRTRIASDLHDDIGSSLSQIAILSEVVRARIVPAAPEVEEPLARIGALSRESVDAMGDIVWAISPHRDTPTHLSQRMRRLASDLLPPRGIQLQFESSDDGLSRLGIEARREVFLLFKEALHNIVRHAGATEVSIALTIGRRVVRLAEDLIDAAVVLVPRALVDDAVVDRADVGDAVGRPDRADAGRGAAEIAQVLGRVHGRAVAIEQVGGVRVRARAHHEVAERLGLDGVLLARAGALAHTFVGEEEERPVAAERAADADAVVVLGEVGLRRLEVALRAEVAVAVELERAAAELVGAAARHEADDAAGVAAELGGGIVGDDLPILRGQEPSHLRRVLEMS